MNREDLRIDFRSKTYRYDLYWLGYKLDWYRIELERQAGLPHHPPDPYGDSDNPLWDVLFVSQPGMWECRENALFWWSERGVPSLTQRVCTDDTTEMVREFRTECVSGRSVGTPGSENDRIWIWSREVRPGAEFELNWMEKRLITQSGQKGSFGDVEDGGYIEEDVRWILGAWAKAA